MLDTIRKKVRALVEDFLVADSELFTYTTSNIFGLCEENTQSITKVWKNGVEVDVADYSFNSSTNKVTITAPLSSGDKVEIKYTFYKYSDTDLKEYVRSALVWISIYAYEATDYEIEDDDEIYPTPSNKDTDLMSIISSILIKPDYSVYRLPNITVKYPRSMSKEDRIERLITRYKTGLGVNNTLDWS